MVTFSIIDGSVPSFSVKARPKSGSMRDTAGSDKNVKLIGTLGGPLQTRI